MGNNRNRSESEDSSLKFVSHVHIFYYKKQMGVYMNIINTLKKLNAKALNNGDVPVSCIILFNNKIISTGYNMRVKKNNPLLHAEVVAIQKAAKKLKTWNLSECDLICTMKPCSMCLEIIKSAKIKKVYYILDNKKDINNKIMLTSIYDTESDYFLKEIQVFFSDKR